MHHFTESDENEITVRVKRMIEKTCTVHKITEDVKYTDHWFIQIWVIKNQKQYAFQLNPFIIIDPHFDKAWQTTKS